MLLMKATPSNTSRLVPFTEADFIPLPAKTLDYRGIRFSRSTILRLKDQRSLKLVSFRFTGKTKPRLYIPRESLDAFIEGQLSQQQAEGDTRPLAAKPNNPESNLQE